MFEVFSLRAAPFSWSKFAMFMGGLAAIAVVSLLPDRGRETRMLDPTANAAGAAQEETYNILRLGQPADEVSGQLRQIGLPWFLRREGATGRSTSDGGDGALAIEVVYKDKPVGRFIERVVAIDEDRSKLLVAFSPSDRTLLQELARPIDTRLDPVSFMRVTMVEHARSSLNGDGFDLGVVDGGANPLVSLIGRFLHHIGPCPPPPTDDFALCGPDQEAANIRRAYRGEGAHARDGSRL